MIIITWGHGKGQTFVVHTETTRTYEVFNSRNQVVSVDKKNAERV